MFNNQSRLNYSSVWHPFRFCPVCLNAYRNRAFATLENECRPSTCMVSDEPTGTDALYSTAKTRVRCDGSAHTHKRESAALSPHTGGSVIRRQLLRAMGSCLLVLLTILCWFDRRWHVLRFALAVRSCEARDFMVIQRID